MKKTALITALTLVSSAALGSTSYIDANVIESTPIYRTVEITTPLQECWEEEVVRTDSYRARQSRTPDILGAIIGGAIGNAVGHHKRNKQVGTVVGAILGGSIARDIKHQNEGRSVVYHDTVERCQTVYDSRQEQKLVGYDVLYSYNGRDYSVRMPQDPGATIRLRVNVEPAL